MKIEKLIIYGFGKHENLHIKLGSGMNVLYGLNEAGKTTIQQFVLHILFGFPQKNSTLLRYEPKRGEKYGGQVHVIDDLYGKCIVERVRGKSAGDVIVYFEDGRKGNEVELELLLRQYDRISFESIFSFSLLQLQEFEKMDEVELSRTLLASGTTGVDSMMQLEKRMEKEMGDLFKKSGKIPAMNVKIEELRALEKQLHDEKEKVEEYAPSIQRLGAIDERLVDLREQEKQLQEELRRLALMRQLLPLHHKRKTLESRLVTVSTVAFPADGIRRYETLSSKLAEAEIVKQRMEKELAEIAMRMPKDEERKQIIELENIVAKESEWHGWRTAVTVAEDEKRRLMSRQRNLFDRLGVQEEANKTILLQADVSLRKEEEMYELMEGLSETDRQFEFTEHQFVQVKNEWQETKNELEFIESTAPTLEEMELGREWPATRQRLAEAKAYVSFGKSTVNRQSPALLASLFLLAIAIMIFGFIRQEWLLILVGLLVVGIGIFFYIKKSESPQSESKMREMEKWMAAYDGNEQQMESLVARIDTYNRKKEKLQEVLQACEKKRDVLETELDLIQNSRNQIESDLSKFLLLYGFDGLLSRTIVPELFSMIREVQNVAHELEANEVRLQGALQHIDERAMEVETILQQSVPHEAMYEIVRREFSRRREVAELSKSLTINKDRVEISLIEATGLVESLQGKLQALFAEARVEEGDELYGAFAAHQEAVLLKGQLDDLQLQLEVHGTIHLPKGITNEGLVLKEEENKGIRASIAEELNTLVNERAALVTKTDKLLTDETYGQQLQLFEMKKAELADLARKWSERKAVSEAIKRIMTELKEEKLPQVLQAAERLFTELTDGKYVALEVTEKAYFEVVSNDGMRYPIIELSQATKEQAYISLRLALAASLADSAPFPMIMDDPFVHFDAERLSRMVELLDGLQTKRQFIYFTCHPKMKNQWQKATTINVSELGSEQGAIV